MRTQPKTFGAATATVLATALFLILPGDSSAGSDTNAANPEAIAAQAVAAAAGKPVGMEMNTTPGDKVAEILVLDDLSLPDALGELAKHARLLVQVDPALLNQKAANGNPMPPPKVKERWRAVTPNQALQALLDNYGWQMERDSNNPIIRIHAKDPNAVGPPLTKVNVLDKSLAAGAPAAVAANATARDEVVEAMTFDDLPLPDAIRELALLSRLNIQIDPRLANPQDTNHHPILSPRVSEKMKNITPRQAMQSLLDEFGWQATRINGNPILRITARDPQAP